MAMDDGGAYMTAEQTLKEVYAAIKRSGMVIDSAPDGKWILRTETELVDYSSSCSKCTDLSWEEFER